jgi:hypothetical protein
MENNGIIVAGIDHYQSIRGKYEEIQKFHCIMDDHSVAYVADFDIVGFCWIQL